LKLEICIFMIKNNPKRTLMFVMGVLVLIGFGIAQLFYTYENSTVDPRIIEARQLYSKYDSYAEVNNFNAVLGLLDSVEHIYNSIDFYKNSFEVGVLYNNRAATYLTMAIHFDTNSLSLDGVYTLAKDTLLNLSEKMALQSIQIYSTWISNYSNKSESELKDLEHSSFAPDFNQYSAKKIKRFEGKKIEELLESQLETPRRLSVAYTNLGIIKRHQEKYDEAIKYYEQAIKLWDQNLAAENNLNMLLSRPLKKQNMLEKFLPPKKNK
jgi:tetratricopeptide (TPR) repeat protein